MLFYTVGVVIGMEAVITPGLRTLVAQLVKREDLGKIPHIRERERAVLLCV